MTKYIGVFVVDRATGEIKQELQVEEILSEQQKKGHFQAKESLDLRESPHGDFSKLKDAEWVAHFPYVFVEIDDD